MCIFILPIFTFRLSRRQGARVGVIVVVVGGCAQLQRWRAREECDSAAFSVELEHGAILRLRSETRGGVPPSVFSYGKHVLLYERNGQSKEPFLQQCRGQGGGAE